MKKVLLPLLIFSCLFTKAQVASNATLSTLITDHNKYVKIVDSLRQVINAMPVLDKTQYAVTGTTAKLKFPLDSASKIRIDSIVVTDKIVHKADDDRHNALTKVDVTTDQRIDTAIEYISDVDFRLGELAASLQQNGLSDEQTLAIIDKIIALLKSTGTNFLNLKR